MLVCLHLEYILISLGGKKGNRGPSFKISSVSVNAQAIVKAGQELEPLAAAIPADADERKRYVMEPSL